MKSFLICEYDPAPFIQGFGLHTEDGIIYIGKAGRNELSVVPSAEHIKHVEGNIQIIYIGTVTVDSQFRPGDILMVGKDELIDEAFKVLDEMEKRGIVVSLEHEADSKQITINKDHLKELILSWKERHIPYLCLLTGEQPQGEDLNSLLMLTRRIVMASADHAH